MKTKSDQEDIIMYSCIICGSQDITHIQKEGRGFPPESFKPHLLMPVPRISWKGIWDVYTCNNCGKIHEELRKKIYK